MEWTTACPDWEERIVNGDSLIPFEPLFPDEAEAALAVFKSLPVVDVPWIIGDDGTTRPQTFGECCEQWVFDLVAAIFGSYDAENATRRINEFLLLIAKKNAKSTIAAGIMVTALLRNWRHANELLILAPTKEVAGNSFAPAKGMVQHGPEEVRTLLKENDNLKTITHLTTGAVLKIVAADSDTLSGKKAGFVLVEELWAFGKKPKSAAMLQEATGGLIARPEGFVIYVTTHSDEPPAGVWKAKLEYFRDVRDGVIKDRKRLGVLYEFPQKMLDDESYQDPENFYITNPNLGRSVSGEWLGDKLREAMAGGAEGIGDKQTFLAKHLNIPIGINLRRDRWEGADYWQAAADAEIVGSLDELIERCEVCVVGIDGGGRDDLLGLCVMGREKETGRWLMWVHAWCWPETLERRKEISERLRDLQRAGDLTICADVADDVFGVADIAERLMIEGLLPEKSAIGVDAAGISAVLDELALRGLASEQIVAIPQGYRLNGVTKGMARKLADGSLRHGGQPLMAWCVGNAKTELRGNATYVTKQASGTMKIDPLIAAFNAFDLMSRHPQASGGPSVYQKRGALVL